MQATVHRARRILTGLLASSLLFAGCSGSASREKTWHEHVAPIVHAHCADCHRTGGGGPFPLLEYAQVRKRARQVAEVTASKYMPPFMPAAGYEAFRHERRLSAEEIATLQDWFAAGAPEGDPAKAVPLPEFSSAWPLGEPDLVLRLPEAFTLPADGVDVYRNFVIPIPIEKTRYVQALVLKPDDPRQVHHAFTLFDPSPTSRRLDAQEPGPGYSGMAPEASRARSMVNDFGSWQPGKIHRLGGPDETWELEPGTDLVLQLHMQPRGREEAVQVSVGLHFTDQVPRHTTGKIALRSLLMDIPPGAQHYAVSDAFVLPVDVEVLGLLPHAHYLGKRIEGFAELPNGYERVLLLIEDWDFNWQGDYAFVRPVALPRGTRLNMKITYDNSAENPRNPRQPPQRVRFGLNATDEMAELTFLVRTDSPEALRTLQVAYSQHAEERSLAYFLSVLERDPGDAQTLAVVGDILMMQGRLQDARPYLERAVQADPTSASTQCMLGSLHLKDGQFAEAATHFEAAIRADPAYARAHGSLGLLRLKEKQLVSAEAHLAAALELDPGDAMVTYNLGLVAYQRGQLDRALQYFHQALRIDPAYGPASRAIRLIEKQP